MVASFTLPFIDYKLKFQIKLKYHGFNRMKPDFNPFDLIYGMNISLRVTNKQVSELRAI